MRPRKHQALVVFCTAVCLFLSLFAQTPVQALTPSPFSVPLYAHQAYSHPDGSMTFAECYSLPQAYSTQRAITVSPEGTTLTSLAKPANSTTWGAQTCEGGPVTGLDSTIYVVESKSSGNGYTNYRIAAYKQNMQLWTYSLDMCTTGQVNGRPKWLTLGYDDNLYAAMDSSCSTSDKLVGINTSTGASLFSPIAFTQNISWYKWFVLDRHAVSEYWANPRST